MSLETDQVALSNSVRMDEASRDTLASSIEDKLAAAFSADDEATTDEVSAEVETPAETETEVKETPAEEAGTEEKTETETETEAEAAATTDEIEKVEPSKNAPTLPAAYRRSLKAYEWTDEEIADALKQGGQSFVATAAKIHANRNTEVQRWAEAGRAARQQQTATPSKDAATETPADEGLLKPVDVATLKKQYGDEALVDTIAGPVNRAIEQINKIIPVIQQSQRQAKTSELETIGRQVDSFFGGKEMDSYKDMYGTDTAKLTNEQYAGRQKVLEMADALIGGARQQGRALSLEEALTLAHDSVSGPVRDKAARTAIAKQLKTREKGITLKPSSRGTATAIGGSNKPAKTEAERLAKVSAGLKAAFG